MKKWDVVLLAYPFTDLSGAKVRPAIVLSPNSESQSSTCEDAVFLLITTNTTRQSAFDFVLARTHPDFQMTGLRADSAIRVNKIWTLKKVLVRQTLGTLSKSLQVEVENRLRDFFEL